MERLEAVIFDLDGVIADTACLHEESWRYLCEQVLQFSLEDSFFDQIKGIGRIESLRMILQSSGQGDRFSEQEILALTTHKNQYYQERIAELTPDDTLPGIQSLLSELKQNQIRLGLASASQNAPLVLQKLQLSSYFEVVVPITQAIPAKPDPAIFLAATKLLGVQPRNCVGIEDAAAGVTSILRSGMVAIGIGNRELLSHAHICLPSTDKLTWLEIYQSFQLHQQNESS